MKQIQRFLTLCAVTLLVAGCGGGGGGGGSAQPGLRTADVAFTVANKSAADPALNVGTVPVQGVVLTATLPQGVTVPTAADGTTIAPSALTGFGLPAAPSDSFTGTVDPATREVRIGVATAQEPKLVGPSLEVAKLAVNYTGDAPPVLAAPTLVQAAGHNVTTGTTEDLTWKLNLTASVTPRVP